jgi:hypothetical protein
MFKVKKNILIVMIAMASLAIANFALAAAPDLGLGIGNTLGLSVTDPKIVITNIIRIVLGFLGIIAVILIIYGGFIWMTAAGNEDRVDTAKKILVSAVIGLLIILSAFAITTFVLNNFINAIGNGDIINPPPKPPLPPGPTGTSCDGNTLTPNVCDADDTLCLPGLFCDTSSCTCRSGGINSPCDGDTATAGCQVKGSMCGSGLFCDNNSCTCQSGHGEGQPCDSDINTAGCQADQNICSNDLTCDSIGANPSCKCEEYPVIDWVSPVGGFCLDQQDKSCASNADCTLTATSKCATSTPAAKPGNIISVGGKYFGAAGTVYFWDGSDFTIPGKDPSTVNPNCNSSWSEGQIIVVVPNGARSGALRIVRSDNHRSDETNNDRGPKIENLVINNIAKPGLCQINPMQGRLEQSINYYGINLLNSQAKFGTYQTSIAGKNSSFAAINGTADVPNIRAGDTTTFVFNSDDQPSNYLVFTKSAEPKTDPYIVSFEPQSGAPGQYVTIHGSGFGGSRGANAVYFGNVQTGIEADYRFPDVCAQSVWNDKQIIVKVPTGAANGNNIITIKLGANSIDTSLLSPNNFNINNSLPLLPSLCKISPVMGQVGTPVSLWGEYFDAFNAATSKVRFFSNNDVGGSDISFWDIDPAATGSNRPYKIETKVPAGALTGPVVVVKGSPEAIGNSLNFSLGNCLDAADQKSACEPQSICCPVGTYQAGRCADDISQCAVDIPSGVFEFDFNTGVGTINNFKSCEEKSKILSACSLGVCPNSPGVCSLFAGNTNSQIVGNGCTDAVCAGKKGCENSACVYDKNINKCVDKNLAICGLPLATKNSLQKNVSAHCSLGLKKYVFDNSDKLSCPSGWVKQLDDLLPVCVNENVDCAPCPANLSCVDSGSGSGVCAASDDICPAGSTCQNDGQCKKDSSASCSCCCRKAPEFAGQDCCKDLTCEGACGTNASTSGGDYGSCSGCTRRDGAGVVDQAASDNACNCAISSGKYCDVTGAGGRGVCGDCAAITDKSVCTAHQASCCVDPAHGGCTSLLDPFTKNVFTVTTGSDNVGYCTYYQCNNKSCGAADPLAVMNNPSGFFKSLSECSASCSAPNNSGLGNSCATVSTPAKPANSCNISVCASPFSCLNANGSASVFGGSTQDTCGFCCCNPNDSNNECASLNASKPNLALVCKPNVGPCDGAGRGLCCGCTANTDCVPASVSPDAQGCGTDSCCRSRASISETIPADGATGVCANSLIEATFNQRMDISSFSGNVIVAGEYDSSEECPQGSAGLTAFNSSTKVNPLVQNIENTYNIIKKPLAWIFGQTLEASVQPDSNHKYCGIVGTISGRQVGENQTVIKFQPRSLMEASRKYFVIVKGDSDLDNKKGILNYWGIGMNAADVSPVVNTFASPASFDGIVYPRAYIWSFTILPDTDGNKGACAIDHVKILPPSYLFQTINNDLNENDANSADKSFDTAADRDKVFTAEALSRNNQILHPVSNYSWDWTWSVEDQKVASIVNPGPFTAEAEQQLIKASEIITGTNDKKTIAQAKVNILNSTIFQSEPTNSIATSTIYVFICAKPWPAADPFDGSWRPWLDFLDGMSCVSGSGGCNPMNYELYYCRDEGSNAVLPALSTGTTRGSGADSLKESFFFRQ